MKFNSFIYTFLFLGILNINLFSQTNIETKPCGSINMAVKLKAMHQARNVNSLQTQKNNPTNLSSVNQPSSTLSKITNPIVSSQFIRISGSSDIFGNLYTNVKPLQYNHYLNALTFIQRKSATYSPSSDGNAGTVVAMIGRNYGATWDSTCVWTNTLNVAQIPQGALYDPPVNLNVNNSYVIATGATMSGTNISGSFYASKLTGTVGTNAPGLDEQFFPNTTTFSTTTSPLMTKHDYPQFGFASTEDGVVRTVGMIYNDVNGITDAVKGLRGAHISKGIFTAGVMVWTSDSLIPPTLIKTDGSKQLWSQPYMALNDAGTVGYVMMLGSRQGATGSNIGWQPLIYKTTNSGNSWVLINGVDFNSGSYTKILNSMSVINTSSLTKVPFFNPFEGIDLTIDGTGKLHIVTTIQGTAKSDVDSLTYIHQYTLATQPSTEQYSWQYKNNAWPYIFDFTGDGTAQWGLTIIDSIGTEGPSNIASMPGFTSNPWANQSQINPVSSTMRLQMSRTYDGSSIIYTWAESDTTLTTNSLKWNEFPNVHVRSLRVCDWVFSKDEYLVSSPPSGFNPKVRDKAYFHHVSPVTQFGTTTSSSTTYTIPLTVSNNTQKDGNLPVDHYLGKATITFTYDPSNYLICLPEGVKSNHLSSMQFQAFPNPFTSNLNLKFNLSQAETINIEMYNYVGQKISSYSIRGESGENNYEVKNTEQLKSGIYFIKLKLLQGDVVTKVIKE